MSEIGKFLTAFLADARTLTAPKRLSIANGYFGTPINPVAKDRVPGGSSSGSAVAVALNLADVALRDRHSRLDPCPGSLLRSRGLEDDLWARLNEGCLTLLIGVVAKFPSAFAP